MPLTLIILIILVYLPLSLLPLPTAAIIKSFYDDRITVSVKRFLISAAGMFLWAFTIGILSLEINRGNLDYNTWRTPYLVLSLVLTFLIYYIQPIIFCARRGMKFFYYLESIILFHIVAIIYYMSVWSLAKLIVKLTQLLLNDTDPLTKLLKLEDNSVLFVAILIGLIVYIWLYFSFMRKKIFLKMRFTDNLMFLLYYGASFCGAQVVTSASIEFLPSFVRTGGMIICTALIIFMPIMILKIRQSAYYNEMSTRNEQFLEAELIASNAYKQSQEDTRAFRHDMNNNLSLVSAMMKKKQYDEAEEYINGLCGRLSSFSPSVVTGDDMLDSLISSKIPVMREKGIRFAIDGVIDGGLGWKPIDICAVFANLIDNAIEACEKVSSADAYITLLLRKTEHQRVITLKNSTARRVDTAQLSSGSHFTSKADRSRHGFGIKNIQDTAEKNGAMVRFECSDTEFTASVIIMRAGVMK